MGSRKGGPAQEGERGHVQGGALAEVQGCKSRGCSGGGACGEEQGGDRLLQVFQHIEERSKLP